MADAIAKHPAGIMIQPWDTTLAPLIDQAMKGGIPVAVLDVPMPQETLYAGTDNASLGATAANEIVAAKGPYATVAVSRSLTLTNVTQMYEGFVAQLKSRYPHVRVVADVSDNNDMPTAVAGLKAAILPRPTPERDLCR